jgi:hypothetical protein
MAKKVAKKTARKPAARSTKARRSKTGQVHTCAECGRRGHNARSHQPGGRLWKRRP